MVMCLNKMDLVSEARRRVGGSPTRGRHKRDPGLWGAGGGDLPRHRVEEERMRVFIPHRIRCRESPLWLAEIHAQENTESGLWMDVSLPRSAWAYASYRV